MNVLLSLVSILLVDSPRPIIPDSAADLFLESYSKSQSATFKRLFLVSGQFDSDYHSDKVLIFSLADLGKASREKRGIYIVAFLTVGFSTSEVLFISEDEILADSISGWEDNGYGNFSIIGQRCLPSNTGSCEPVPARITVAVEDGLPRVLGGRYGKNPRHKLVPEN